MTVIDRDKTNLGFLYQYHSRLFNDLEYDIIEYGPEYKKTGFSKKLWGEYYKKINKEVDIRKLHFKAKSYHEKRVNEILSQWKMKYNNGTPWIFMYNETYRLGYKEDYYNDKANSLSIIRLGDEPKKLIF